LIPLIPRHKGTGTGLMALGLQPRLAQALKAIAYPPYMYGFILNLMVLPSLLEVQNDNYQH
jgi:hypothetical protein